MTISEKSAYLKGLMEGMDIDANSANGKLMAEFVPYGGDYLAGGAAGADGYGIKMMQEVGAGVVAMDAIPTFPMGLVSKDTPKTGAIANTYAYKAGGIVINQNGERFCDETDANPAVREVALEDCDAAVGHVGIFDGADDFGIQVDTALDILAPGLAGDSHQVEIQKSLLVQLIHDGIDTAGLVEVFHVGGACRSQVAEVGSPV